MKTATNDKGFRSTILPQYGDKKADARLLTESTMIGEHEDSLTNPGSSYLWIGSTHHLDRDEVSELINHLQTWLETKRLPEPNGD